MRRIAALVALVLALLAGCGGSDAGSDDDGGGPTRLTQSQAELLATVRFRNFDAGVRSVSVDIPASAGAAAGRLTGWVDFAGHLGYASAEQGGSPLGSLVWSSERIAVNESAATPATFPIPESGWRSDQLDPQTSSLTQALAITLNLGSDRPENPLLLRQSDAAFLRSDVVDGREVSVIVGPSPASDASGQPAQDRIRYWIDDDGLLRRVEAKLTGTTDWTVIDLAETDQALDAQQIATLLAPTGGGA